MGFRSWLSDAWKGPRQRFGRWMERRGASRQATRAGAATAGPTSASQLRVSDSPLSVPVPGPILKRLRLMQRDFEQATARLGFIGESGSGKSSLINAIVGQPVAAVGALIETTQQAQEVPVDGLTLVDLPGCGTARWPRETYIE